MHFLHISKTGGTAVKHALRGRSPGPSYHVVFHGHATGLRDVPRGERFIGFLRDPAQRFVSGFCSRRNQGMPRYHVPWSAAERRVFARYDTPNQLALDLSSSDPEAREYARWAMGCLQLVREPSLRWFESEAYFEERRDDLLLLGFQETLAADFAALRDRLGYDGSIALPDDPVDAHRGRIDVDRGLCEQALANLREWYAPDYRFIAFCLRMRGDKTWTTHEGSAEAANRTPAAGRGPGCPR